MKLLKVLSAGILAIGLSSSVFAGVTVSSAETYASGNLNTVTGGWIGVQTFSQNIIIMAQDDVNDNYFYCFLTPTADRYDEFKGKLFSLNNNSSVSASKSSTSSTCTSVDISVGTEL